MLALLHLFFFVSAIRAAAVPVVPADISLASRDQSLTARQTFPHLHWRFWINGHIVINDDETIGSDEHWEGDFEWPTFVLDQSSNASYNIVQRMGGEIRAEIQLTAITYSLGTGQYPSVSYTVKLYEGTSEDTNDLDGQTQGQVETTYPGTGNAVKASFDVTVRNDDENVMDDYVHVTADIIASQVIQ